MIGDLEERRRVDLLEFASAGGGMSGECQTIIEAHLLHAYRKPEHARDSLCVPQMATSSQRRGR